MNAFSRFAFLLLFVSASSAPAAIISRDWKTPGDGLLTYDDVSKREWLDLTQTILIQLPGPGNSIPTRYQQVVARLSPGQVWDGFSVAALADVQQLLLSAGLPATTTVGTDLLAPATNFVALLTTPTNPPVTNAPFTSRGLVSELNPNEPSGTPYAVYVDSFGVRIPYSDSPSLSSVGVFLYRAVPEPSAIRVSFFGLITLCLVFSFSRTASRKGSTYAIGTTVSTQTFI